MSTLKTYLVQLKNIDLLHKIFLHVHPLHPWRGSGEDRGSLVCYIWYLKFHQLAWVQVGARVSRCEGASEHKGMTRCEWLCGPEQVQVGLSESKGPSGCKGTRVQADTRVQANIKVQVDSSCKQRQGHKYMPGHKET